MSIKIPPSAEIEISDGHSAAAYAVCPGQKPRISVRQRKILKIRFMNKIPLCRKDMPDPVMVHPLFSTIIAEFTIQVKGYIGKSFAQRAYGGYLM